MRTFRILAAAGLGDETDAFDGGDELGGRAVHDRRLRPVDLDKGVVDAEAGERGHQMLDGGDGRPGAVADHGAERGLADVAPARLDQTVRTVGHAGAQEDDAVIGIGGMDDDAGGSCGMNA